MRASIGILSLSFILCLFASGQENEIAIDTTLAVNDTLHSPRKAALYSALLPGAGQLYNHLAKPKGKRNAFWKVPLIYGGLGATAYFAIKNQQLSRTLRDEYTYRIKNGDENLEEYQGYDNQGILTLYEQSKRSRDLMIFAFIAVYGLNVLDAHVEAHFIDFDVSKDLSLHVRPVMHDFSTPGLSLSLNFR